MLKVLTDSLNDRAVSGVNWPAARIQFVRGCSNIKIKENVQIQRGNCVIVVKKSPRTDIGVHLATIQGLDELPEAFLVAVHFPVATDEEFPAHVCGFFLRDFTVKMKKTTEKHSPCLGRKSER